MPYKQWVSGELVTAADFQTQLQDQAVLAFPSAGARDAAILSPVPGMHAYLTDTRLLTVWTGSAWAPTARTMRMGVYTFNLDNANEATATVTFSAAFPTAPVVVATARPFSTRRYLATITSVTTASFNLWITEINAANGTNTVEVQWIAIG